MGSNCRGGGKSFDITVAIAAPLVTKCTTAASRQIGKMPVVEKPTASRNGNYGSDIGKSMCKGAREGRKVKLC